MTIHDGIEEKATSGVRRGGLRGDDCLSMRILDGVIGGEVGCGMFPDETLGGRQTGGRRKLVYPLFDGRLGEQGKGTLDHVSLAVWTFLSHVDAEGGLSLVCRMPEVEIRRRNGEGCRAEDWFPSAPEHPGK